MGGSEDGTQPMWRFADVAGRRMIVRAALQVGLLPGAEQTVPRAELMSGISQGRDTNHEAVIHTDCAYVWNRCVKAETRSTRTSSNAYLLERFRRARERVRCRIDFIKIPTHTEIQVASRCAIAQTCLRTGLWASRLGKEEEVTRSERITLSHLLAGHGARTAQDVDVTGKKLRESGACHSLEWAVFGAWPTVPNLHQNHKEVQSENSSSASCKDGH